VQVLLSHCFAKQCTKLELVTLVPLIHLRALFSPSFGKLKEEEEEEEKEKGQMNSSEINGELTHLEGHFRQGAS
jgi:hypothetical protein